MSCIELSCLAEVAERRVEDHRVDGVVADEREVLRDEVRRSLVVVKGGTMMIPMRRVVISTQYNQIHTCSW